MKISKAFKKLIQYNDIFIIENCLNKKRVLILKLYYDFCRNKYFKLISLDKILNQI